MIETGRQNVYDPAANVVAVFPLRVMLAPLPPPFWYWPGLKRRLPPFPLKLIPLPYVPALNVILPRFPLTLMPPEYTTGFKVRLVILPLYDLLPLLVMAAWVQVPTLGG